MRSYAILGYDGGAAKTLADVAIHAPIDDMQVSEDMQVIIGHMMMQWLWENRDIVDAMHALR
jgi:D-sedoheptulose 7-phosphate isomerase